MSDETNKNNGSGLSPFALQMLEALRGLVQKNEPHPCGGFTTDDIEWRMGTAFTPQEKLDSAIDELTRAGHIRYAGMDEADAIGHCYEPILRGGASVAREAHNLEVAGSIPAPATIKPRFVPDFIAGQTIIRDTQAPRFSRFESIKHVEIVLEEIELKGLDPEHLNWTENFNQPELTYVQNPS